MQDQHRLEQRQLRWREEEQQWREDELRTMNQSRPRRTHIPAIKAQREGSNKEATREQIDDLIKEGVTVESAADARRARDDY